VLSRIQWSLLGAVLLLLAVAAGLGSKKMQPPAGSALKAWQEYPGDPVIHVGEAVPRMVWNDPSVLRESNGSYRMWLSGGDPTTPQHIVVRVYTATSTDGIHWKIDPQPCLSPSQDPRMFDSLRVETPDVIEAAGRYHMYYSGFDEDGGHSGVSAIGHATSLDGIHWTKDPANPVIGYQMSDKLRWAYGGVGEPGVVFDPKQGVFYLYYVAMRFGKQNPSIGHIGILLATSRDGSHFTSFRDDTGDSATILTRDVPGAIDGSWFGYTNPSPLIATDGRFHLFCTFLVCPKGPASARHVTIDHAVSSDGIHFEVVEKSIFEAAKKDWKDQQVRSPTVLEDNGRFQMWFAGETQTPYYLSGIGYATRER
jgi:hypothetical protein